MAKGTIKIPEGYEEVYPPAPEGYEEVYPPAPEGYEEVGGVPEGYEEVTPSIPEGYEEVSNTPLQRVKDVISPIYDFSKPYIKKFITPLISQEQISNSRIGKGITTNPPQVLTQSRFLPEPLSSFAYFMTPQKQKAQEAALTASAETSPFAILNNVMLGAGIAQEARALRQPFMQQHPFDMMNKRQLADYNADEVVKKFSGFLKTAKPLRAEQEALYTAKRAELAGKISDIAKDAGGEAGYYKQLGALKGGLPKVNYESVRGQLTQGDIDSLFNKINLADKVDIFDQLTAKRGLLKMLEGTTPTNSELKILEQIFPQEMLKNAIKMPFSKKLWNAIDSTINIPRAVMASFDLSAPFRQGLFLVGKPVAFSKAFGKMFKYAFSEKAFRGLMDDIVSRPTYSLMKQGQLPLTDLGTKLTAREEMIMSNLPEKVPLLGKIIRGSNRAYAGFLNKLRADTFDDLVNQAKRLKIPLTDRLIDSIGDFVGSATGRGRLHGSLEKAATSLNALLFSPRLMVSRLNLLNPYYYARLHPMVRREAIKDAVALGSLGLGIMGLSKLGGATVEDNPTNADFGKIKKGNTRYDLWGGFQQYIRLFAQLALGEMTNSTTGVKRRLGEGYKAPTRIDILGNFFRGKLAPVPALVTNLLSGKTALGKDLDKEQLKKQVGLMFVPMVIQDTYDLYQERGDNGIAMAIPALFGIGVQTYSPDASETVYAANSVLTEFKELMSQGKFEEATKLYSKNVELVRIGKTLEPIDRYIKKIKKTQKDIDKNILIDKDKKNNLKATLDITIKNLQKRLDDAYEQLKPRSKNATSKNIPPPAGYEEP